MRAPASKFVKSASTSTPVTNSKRELEKLLTRYGCQAFAVASNFQTGETTINFVVPDTKAKDAPSIPVRFQVTPKVVYDAMYGRPMWYSGGVKVHNPNGYDERWLAQAERVAWRQLILWVDAALSVASSGMAGVAETFLAHTLVRGDDGTIKPMIQHLNETGGGFQRLLSAGAP